VCVWGYDDTPDLLAHPGADTEPGKWSLVEDNPVYSELVTLTERAGSLLEKMCRSGLYSPTLFPANAVPYCIDYSPDFPVSEEVAKLVSAKQQLQRWLAFLIHSLATLGYCRANEPGGAIAACTQLVDGQTTLAWIDHYAAVCLAGLATLAGVASDGSRPAEAPGAQPDWKALLEAVADENAVTIMNVAQDQTISADDKMRRIYAIDNRAIGWNSTKWARLLRITPQAVRQCEWWRTERKQLRGENQADAEKRAKDVEEHDDDR
jgi:hypothetical protein